MKPKDAREILARPVFGDPRCIAARDVLLLAEEVARLPRSVPRKIEEMDESEMRYELECTEFRSMLRRRR